MVENVPVQLYMAGPRPASTPLTSPEIWMQRAYKHRFHASTIPSRFISFLVGDFIKLIFKKIIFAPKVNSWFAKEFTGLKLSLKIQKHEIVQNFIKTPATKRYELPYSFLNLTLKNSIFFNINIRFLVGMVML